MSEPVSGQAEVMRALFEHWDWPLPRSDDRWCSVRCQNHDDGTASARVWMDTGAYVCLACGISAGSPLGLVKAVRQCGLSEALTYLQGLGIDPRQEAQVVAPTGPPRPWKGRRRLAGWRARRAGR